jgi:hypothetical protein
MATPQLTPEELKRQIDYEASVKRAQEYYKAIGFSTATIAKNTEILKSDSKALQEAVRVAEDYFDRMAFSTRDLAQTFSNVLEDVKGTNIHANKGVAAFKQLNNIAGDLARHQEGLNKLEIKELENLQKKFSKNKDILFDSIDLIKNKKEQSQLEKNLLAEYEEASKLGLGRVEIEKILGKKIQDELETEKNITKELNVSGAILKSTVGLMDKLGLGAFTQVMNLEKANEALDDEYRKTGDLKKAFSAATAELFNGLKHALNDPVTSLAVYGSIAKKAFTSFGNDVKNLYHGFVEINKESATLGRSLGTSSENAHHIVEETKSIGRAMGDVTLTGNDYAKTMAAAAESLGLQVDLGGETYHELAKMNEMMGLTADESTQIYKLGKLNNQELSKTNQEIAAGVVSAQKQLKIQINAKQVFQEIGKLNAGITTNFKQNPEALAKAVVQAKALGSNLDKMDAAASSLLNFEQSIQNELEAELLTGKKINLEKAREAALNNDQVGFMNAIAEQTGTIAEYNEMNRFQQEAIAKAFGFQRTELAGMLQEQEVFNKLGDISGKTAEEQLAIARERGLSEEDSLVKSLQQQAQTEKLEKTFEGLKETIAGLVSGPLGQMVGKMAEMLNTTGGIATIIGIMATSGITKLIVGFASLAKAARIVRGIEIGSTIAKAWGAAMSGPQALLTGGLAGLAIGAGLTAAIMAATSIDTADDMFSGYGDRTLVTPKGSYALNNSDTVIAGTNLFRGNDVYSGPKDSINLTGGVDSKLEALTNSITALASRPVTIKANTDTIMRLNTAQSQYGSPNLFA